MHRPLFILLLLSLLLPYTLPAQLPRDGGCSIQLRQSPPLKGLGYRAGFRTWPGGIIPYYYEAEDQPLDAQLRAIMEEAITTMNEQTNVCWVPAGNRSGSAVRIFKSEENYNYATLGYSSGRSTNDLAMISKSVGIGLHEMAHSMGIWHEQQRPDRDQYVEVDLQQVEAGFEHNFTIAAPAEDFTYETPYDLNSIMHYPAFAFARGVLPTVIRVDGQRIANNRDTLTRYDIQQVNSMYAPVPREECERLILENSIAVAIEGRGAIDSGTEACPNFETVYSAVALNAYQEGNRYRWSNSNDKSAIGSGSTYRTTFDRPGRHTIFLEVTKGRHTKTIKLTVQVTTSADELTVFGNPVAPGNALRYQLTSEEPEYTLSLVDAAGRVVYREAFTATSCQSEGSIPTTGLAAGIYHLTYTRGGYSFGKRVVIL